MTEPESVTPNWADPTYTVRNFTAPKFTYWNGITTGGEGIVVNSASDLLVRIILLNEANWQPSRTYLSEFPELVRHTRMSEAHLRICLERLEQLRLINLTNHTGHRERVDAEILVPTRRRSTALVLTGHAAQPVPCPKEG